MYLQYQILSCTYILRNAGVRLHISGGIRVRSALSILIISRLLVPFKSGNSLNLRGLLIILRINYDNR